MPKFETVPGERSASIISSIINLVCPRCGGSMMEFQCNRRFEPEFAGKMNFYLSAMDDLLRQSEDQPSLGFCAKNVTG